MTRRGRGRKTAPRPAWPLLLGALLAATSGCSFSFVRPSAVTPAATADCTDGDGWPLLDAALGVGAAAATLYAANRSYDDRAGTLQKEDAVIGGAVVTAFFVGSSAAGFSRVNECRQAKKDAVPLANAAALSRTAR